MFVRLCLFLCLFAFVPNSFAQTANNTSPLWPWIAIKPLPTLTYTASLDAVSGGKFYIEIRDEKTALINFNQISIESQFDPITSTLTAEIPNSISNTKTTYTFYFSRIPLGYDLKSLEMHTISPSTEHFQSRAYFHSPEFGKNYLIEKEAEIFKSTNGNIFKKAAAYNYININNAPYLYSEIIHETNLNPSLENKHKLINKKNYYYKYKLINGKLLSTLKFGSIYENNGSSKKITAEYTINNFARGTILSASSGALGENVAELFQLADNFAALRNPAVMDYLMTMKKEIYFNNKEFSKPVSFIIEYTLDKTKVLRSFIPKVVITPESKDIYLVNGEPDIITEDLKDQKDIFIKFPSDTFYNHKIPGYSVKYGEISHGFGLIFQSIYGELPDISVDYPNESFLSLNNQRYKIETSPEGVLSFPIVGF